MAGPWPIRPTSDCGMVRLFLEEGYSASLLREQFGVSGHSIQRWVRAYRRHGAEGLEPKRSTGGRSRVPAEVRQRMVEAKKDHPQYGPRRITDVFKRFFLIRTSAASVHKTLAAEGMVKEPKVKRATVGSNVSSPSNTPTECTE
ncbi:helix-turn-helix domain-containing protein [Thermodesulfobacteriota bacterium]